MKNYLTYYILAIACFVFAFVAPNLFTGKDYHHFGINTGGIGDTIGGLTAPFLSLAGSILVFAALRAQIDANKAVQEQFSHQQIENNKREIEQKLFRLFDLHLEIVRSSQITAKQLESTNSDADYPFTEIIGFEYHHKIEHLLKEFDYISGLQLFEQSIEMFEWTMFDGVNAKIDAITPDKLVSIVLYYYLEKMREVTYRYFNNVFYIIDTIEQSLQHNESEKKDFMNLYLNHFSYSEIKWLFWISFHEDYKNYQAILEKYQCFKRINYDDLTTKGYGTFPERYDHLKIRFDEVRNMNQ